MNKKISKKERLEEIRKHLSNAAKYRDLESSELSKAWNKINNIIREDEKNG